MKNLRKDPYWENIGFIFSQFSGLVDGSGLTNEDISIWDLQLLNGVGDLIDLTRALFPEDRPEIEKMNFTEFQTLKHENGHCSALVRVLPGSCSHSYLYYSCNVWQRTYRITIKRIRRYVYGSFKLVLLWRYQPNFQALSI